MSISSNNWFKYLKEVRHGADTSPQPEVIVEGLRDIGLPEYVIDRIENALPNVPEKAKTFLGNVWKNSTIERDSVRGTPELQDRQFVFADVLADEYSSYLAAPDLDPEKKKKITLILRNLKDAIAKPYGAWRKAFMKGVKALSKVGVPSEKVEHTKETLQEFLEAAWNRWWRQYDDIGSFLNDDPTNYKLAEDARGYDSGQIDLQELLILAREYLENKEDPEQIIHTFDDGSYWFNTQTSNCPIEADRMGHCGSDSRGVLVSLRKKKEKRRESSSYVTMTWNEYDQILYQIKGRSNDAPPRETWGHIEWFIDNMDIRAVEETGEHSNDYEGFEEMNAYLASRTNAKFADDIEEKIQEIEREVERIDETFRDQRDELDVTDVGCSVESGEEYGGDPRDILLYMSCEADFEMDLGWPGFYQKDGFYIATDGPDSERPLDFAEIPTNSWGSEASEFVDQIEIDDIAHELPGEDPETDWEIRMMEGVSGKTTAHLIVRLANRENATGVDSADEYDDYVNRVLEFDSDYQSYREKIRRGLVAGGFIAKSPFDYAEQEMLEMDLRHFDVESDSDGISFTFIIPGAGTSPIESDIKIPGFVIQYLLGLHSRDNENWYNQLYTKMFNAARGNYRPPPSWSRNIEGPALNNAMAAHMRLAFRSKHQAASRDQLAFDFGKDYEAAEAQLVLAEDSRFIIHPQIKYRRSPDVTDLGFKWSYIIQIPPKASAEEVQIVRDIVEYLDKNPEIVTVSAQEIIEQSMEPLIDEAQEVRQKILSPSYFVETVKMIEDRYGLSEAAMAALRTGTRPEDWVRAGTLKMSNIINWFVKSYDKMNEVEKFTMWKRWLEPARNARYRLHGAENQWDENPGVPRNFKDYVAQEMQKLGAAGSSTRQYMQRQEEGIEEQIARVDGLLNEVDPSYDLRIYSMGQKPRQQPKFAGLMA
jgi:hypothetical protein